MDPASLYKASLFCKHWNLALRPNYGVSEGSCTAVQAVALPPAWGKKHRALRDWGEVSLSEHFFLLFLCKLAIRSSGNIAFILSVLGVVRDSWRSGRKLGLHLIGTCRGSPAPDGLCWWGAIFLCWSLLADTVQDWDNRVRDLVCILKYTRPKGKPVLILRGGLAEGCWLVTLKTWIAKSILKTFQFGMSWVIWLPWPTLRSLLVKIRVWHEPRSGWSWGASTQRGNEPLHLFQSRCL